MNEKISEDLEEWFGFKGVLGGEEYYALPDWKKLVADALLSKGIELRIIKSHLETAILKTSQYVKEAQKIVEGKSEAMPLYAKFSDVEE